jgi:long-chain acyl-CoA synthetase
MPLTGRPLEGPVHLPHVLRVGLTQVPDAMALVSSTTRRTWQDLDKMSDNLAGNFLDLGLSPGDRVASLMPNRAALIIHYIACMKSGLVGVPLNYRYTIPEIDRALTVSGASILVAHAERAQELIGSSRVRELPRGLIFHEAEEERGPSLWGLSQQRRRRRSSASPRRATRPLSSSPRAARGRRRA